MSTKLPKSATPTTFDVVVIGGGAAGMMAAATAAARGLHVLVVEKNAILGRKLALTGGGRCNITNNKPDVRTMLAQYGGAGKFLFSTFSQHAVTESLAWFAARGVPVKEENEGRLFPVTESAETVRHALVTELEHTGVAVRCQQAVESLHYDAPSKQFTITTTAGVITSTACILATGGIARPDTGSTGDGYPWLQAFGHTVIPNSNALVPITLQSSWTKTLSGLTLPEVRVSVSAYETKQFARTGRLLFTHVGVSGPLILNMSAAVRDYLDHTSVTLYLDVFPQYDAGELKEYFQTILASNKQLHNILAAVLPRQFVTAVLKELKIDGSISGHSVVRADRTRLRQYLQRIPLPVKGLLGADKAVVSAGGVALEEVDFKTMESKLIPNLHMVGDVLNINRPSGGYSLQICWSTGYVAGMHACPAFT